MTNLQPGMFDLVSKPDGAASMKEKVDMCERLQDELLIYVDGPSRQAVKNMLGVLHFYLDGAQKALEYFQQVISVDPGNINALQNSIFVYRKIRKDSDAKSYEARLSQLLEDKNPNRPLAQARFHAEQGFVMSYDCESEADAMFDEHRIRRATECFEKALKYPEVFDIRESCQWQYFAARAYHRLYDRFLRRQVQKMVPLEWDPVLVRAIQLFHYVISNAADDLYKAKAWALLGTLLFKMPADRHGRRLPLTPVLNACLTECDFLSVFEDPEICFKNAQALRPHDAKLVCRHARMLMSPAFCDPPRAIELLNSSIELDCSKSNWMAFSSRARIRRRQYEQEEKQYCRSTKTVQPGADAACTKQSIQLPDRQLLEMARDDWEKCLKLKPVFSVQISLAEVCHILGKAGYGRFMDKSLMDEALSHFFLAIDGLGDVKTPYLHEKRGYCLEDCGETRGAIESYKTAMECDELSTPYPFNKSFRPLMMLLLSECREKEQPQHIVSEIAFWLDYGFRKHCEGIHKSVARCCRRFAREMNAVSCELARRGDFEVARFVLPTLISSLGDILALARRDDEIDKSKVIWHDMEAARRLLEDLKAKKAAHQALRHDLLTEMSQLSVGKDPAVEGGEAASTANTSRADTSHATEHPTILKDTIGDAIETTYNTKNKKYDFFVLYCDENRDWVLYSLVPKLETHYNLKGFIRDRDILYGEEETGEVIGRIVENSICTIAVLSEAFLQDKWRRKHLTWVFSETEEDDHPILLVKLAECKITKAITRMSQSPVIDSFDWHKLVTSLKDLGKC